MKTFFSLLTLLCLQLSLFSQSTEDEKAIHQLVQTMTEGWTNGDGEQFASVFADQHDFIVWTGYYLRNIGPNENAAAHQEIFDTFYKDTRLYYVVDKIRFIREDIALIHVFGAVSPKSESRPKDPRVLWTGTMEKADGRWKILSFHNLDLEVYQDDGIKAGAPMSPEIMYASWYEAK